MRKSLMMLATLPLWFCTAFGSRRHVEGGTWSERVLFLLDRREGRGGGLCVCLNSEDEERGLLRFNQARRSGQSGSAKHRS